MAVLLSVPIGRLAVLLSVLLIRYVGSDEVTKYVDSLKLTHSFAKMSVKYNLVSYNLFYTKNVCNYLLNVIICVFIMNICPFGYDLWQIKAHLLEKLPF